MFDIGFSELVVIAVVALVVIGPERLPKVARTAGLLLGRAQRYVSAVRADIDREMQLDDLKKLQAEMQESASAIENGIRGGMQSFDESIRQASQPMSDRRRATTRGPDSSVTKPATPRHPPGSERSMSRENVIEPRRTLRNRQAAPTTTVAAWLSGMNRFNGRFYVVQALGS